MVQVLAMHSRRNDPRHALVLEQVENRDRKAVVDRGQTAGTGHHRTGEAFAEQADRTAQHRVVGINLNGIADAPPLLGLPGPPPQPATPATAIKASADVRMRLSQPRTCRVSAPNKILPLLAAQHRSRQTCRDGTPNPSRTAAYPPWGACVQFLGGSVFGPIPVRKANSGEQDGGNLAAIILLAVVLRPAIAEEPRLFAIGAQAKVIDRSDTGLR